MKDKKITRVMIVSSILREYPQATEVFYKYDIDACCWADNSLELAAEDRGVDVEELLNDLNKAILKPVKESKGGVITREMNIGELVKNYPQTSEVLLSKGLHCVGCHVALWESLEEAAAAHGIEEEDFEKLLKELNEAIKK